MYSYQRPHIRNFPGRFRQPATAEYIAEGWEKKVTPMTQYKSGSSMSVEYIKDKEQAASKLQELVTSNYDLKLKFQEGHNFLSQKESSLSLQGKSITPEFSQNMQDKGFDVHTPYYGEVYVDVTDKNQFNDFLKEVQKEYQLPEKLLEDLSKEAGVQLDKNVPKVSSLEELCTKVITRNGDLVVDAISSPMLDESSKKEILGQYTQNAIEEDRKRGVGRGA